MNIYITSKPYYGCMLFTEPMASNKTSQIKILNLSSQISLDGFKWRTLHQQQSASGRCFIDLFIKEKFQ